jgi:gliding motility-associated-like protein
MNKRLLLYSLLFFTLNLSYAQNCLPTWKYYQTVSASNPNASAYTDIQVKIVLNTQALISAGKMNANGDDIRFTDSLCNNLHYWIDSGLNTTATIIWVKLNYLPASGVSNFKMYYGNFCAVAAQNGDSTFLLFDDFDGNTLNVSKWTSHEGTPANSNFVLANGQLQLNATNTDMTMRSVATFNTPIRFEAKVASESGTWPNISLLNSGTFTGVVNGKNNVSNFSIGNASASLGSYGYNFITNTAIPIINGVWGIRWNATNNADGFEPGNTSYNSATTPAISGTLQAALGIAATGTGAINFNWARVRQSIPIDATTITANEVAQSLIINVTPTTICPGSTIRLTFEDNGIKFDSSNNFTIQLSDSAGNFGTPYTFISYKDSILDTMVFELPISTLPSSNYKIRVVSTVPASNCFVSNSSLTVLAKPNISFSILKDSQCYKYNRFDFVSNSNISTGTIDTFVWRYDDGSLNDTTTVNTVSHSFSPFYPFYYPKLTAISNLGCKDSASIRINIQESPVVETEFNDTIQCLKGNFFTIKSVTNTFSGSIVSKSFDIGDGTPVVNNIDSFSHVFTTNGIYNVMQINQHSNGCIDTSYLGCLVNEHPVAGISFNDSDQCLTGNYFIFENTSSINNGLPLVNYWENGDGVNFDQMDSFHYSYNSASPRTIQLITISDDGEDGCADTAYQDIFVNPIPVAGIKTLDNDQCFNYNSFEFQATSTVAYGTMTHQWDMGDLSIINNTDTAIHSYAAEGQYTITMNVTTDKGCVDTTNTSIIVRPSPIPSFSINKDTQCFKYHELKTLSSSSISSGTMSKLWLISDGTDYTDVDSISHVFTSTGKYYIDLILTSDFQCKDTISDSIEILEMPISSFTVNNADQCFEGNNFQFTDNSIFNAGTLTGNRWLFDDGNSADNANIVNHSYASESAYRPGLIVYADNGCFDTSFLNIKVYPHPGSDFFIDDTGQCVNNNLFRFTNNTFISEGAFINRWFFGDGSAYYDGFDATKKYNKDSTYVVKIISFSDRGCTDTISKTVTVFPKAKTSFTIDKTQQCLNGNEFNFNSTTTLKRGVFTTNWQFGDGSNIANASSATHSYVSIGTFNVRLISQTDEGCLDTATQQVKTLAMPVATFSNNYTSSCLLGNDFQFNATSNVQGGAAMKHNWYFGDKDSTINSTFAQHTYATDGNYIVKLVSTTNVGNCSDTTEKTMSVYPMPSASFLIDDNKQCFTNNLFGFTSTSGVSSGTIDIYDWSFGDNTSSALPNPNKSYIKIDSFRVRLNVTTDKGCTDSTAKKVYVYPVPVAKFSVSPPNACLDVNLFSIVNSSTISNNGIISRYSFNYGNNDSVIAQNPPPYKYASNGDYTILLTVISNQGCWDTATAQVQVNPNPNLAFTVDSVCFKDSSYFINESTIASGSIQSWKWLFGNGRTSTLESPSHKYKAIGNYDITLIATTDKNCKDTLFIPGAAKVNPNPKAGFYYVKERSWEKEVDIQYYDTSSGAVQWNWDFSSMGTSTDQNPKLYYDDTLTQYTRLVVTNDYKCRDTVIKVLFIAPDVIYYMPSAFTPNDDNINEIFKPIGLAFAINYKFIIFNRWGEIIFKTDNPQLGWNGQYNGDLVEQDLYFYRLEFVGVDELRHEEQGSIMILR